MKITVQRDALLSARQRLVEAYKRGDVEAIASLCAEDVVVMPPNDTSIFGKAEVLEWFREYNNHFVLVDLTETSRHVTLVEDVAIERWDYQVKIRPLAGGEPIRDDGRFLTVWKLNGETGWQIVQQIWNSIRPIGSGTHRFMALLKQRSEKSPDRT